MLGWVQFLLWGLCTPITLSFQGLIHSLPASSVRVCVCVCQFPPVLRQRVPGDPTLLVQPQLLVGSAGLPHPDPTLAGWGQVAAAGTCSGSSLLASGSFSCGRVFGCLGLAAPLSYSDGSGQFDGDTGLRGSVRSCGRRRCLEFFPGQSSVLPPPGFPSVKPSVSFFLCILLLPPLLYLAVLLFLLLGFLLLFLFLLHQLLLLFLLWLHFFLFLLCLCILFFSVPVSSFTLSLTPLPPFPASAASFNPPLPSSFSSSFLLLFVITGYSLDVVYHLDLMDADDSDPSSLPPHTSSPVFSALMCSFPLLSSGSSGELWICVLRLWVLSVV